MQAYRRHWVRERERERETKGRRERKKERNSTYSIYIKMHAGGQS